MVDPDNQQELLRRLPEIKLIENLELQEQVIDIFLNHCPDYFWEIPASSSGKYHQTDAVGEMGLWLHTKRTFTALERLGRTFVYQGKITEKELDYARASILLHDIFKQGRERTGHTVKDHDRIASEYLSRNTELPQPVIECVDSHNGGWCKGKDPENDLEQLHHLADMMGSDRNQIAKVYKPCEEIREVFDHKLFDPEEGEGINANFN